MSTPAAKLLDCCTIDDRYIEWFYLINGMIQAFLIVPLHTLHNAFRLCGIMFCCLQKSFFGKVFYEVG